MSTQSKTTEPQGTQPRRGCCCGPSDSAGDNARDILDRRYAKGELTKEQYEQLRSAIESGRCAS